MARGIRKREGEDFSRETIKKVISLLEQEKPITKKEACRILNIPYNTSRLKKIIESFKEKEAYSKARRKELSKKPLSIQEVATICQMALDGAPLSSISEVTYRSINTIKKTLEKYNIPRLTTSEYNYFNPPILDDKSITEDFDEGDLVYSARYCRPATIKKLYQVHKIHGKIYSIEFHGEDRFFAYQPYYELADLRPLQKIGITLSDLDKVEVQTIMHETISKAKKGKSNSG